MTPAAGRELVLSAGEGTFGSEAVIHTVSDAEDLRPTLMTEGSVGEERGDGFPPHPLFPVLLSCARVTQEKQALEADAERAGQGRLT